jgi:hypothetical protein
MAKVRTANFVAPMDAAAIGMATGGDVPLLLISGLVTMAVLLATFSRWRRTDGRAAPSPPSLPLLGHLHLLMGKPHCTASWPRWPATRPSSRCAWACARRCWCRRAVAALAGLRWFLAAKLFSTPRLAVHAADRHRRDSGAAAKAVRSGAERDAARGRASNVHRTQEIIEETFAVTGAPSLGDFFSALRWVDRLRGVNATLACLQSRHDAWPRP